MKRDPSKMTDEELNAAIDSMIHDRVTPGTMEHVALRDQARGLSDKELDDKIEAMTYDADPRGMERVALRQQAHEMSNKDLDERMANLADAYASQATRDRMASLRERAAKSPADRMDEIEHESVPPGTMESMALRRMAKDMTDQELSRKMEEVEAPYSARRRSIASMSGDELDRAIADSVAKLKALRTIKKVR
jgi:hypothetical protein